MEWKTIESAPKDGSRFLAYEYIEAFEENVGTDYIYICHWWNGDSLNSARWSGGFYQPTHWMPLPNAPSK